MKNKVIILPTANGIRAARAFLNLKQLNLAHKCGVNINTIIAIENEKSKPTKELLEVIAQVFIEEGIVFNPDGGFSIDKNFVTVFEGKDGYLKAQKDILSTCATDKSEALFLGVDDRRSSNDVIKNEHLIYKAQIPCRYIMSNGHDYILGPLSEYRTIDSSYFFSNDVVVIYKEKISILSSRNGKDHVRVVVLNDGGIANQMRNYFNYLWAKGVEPTKSSSKQVFFR